MSWQTKAVMAEAEAKTLRANFEELGRKKWAAENVARNLEQQLVNERLRNKEDRAFLIFVLKKLGITPEQVREFEREHLANQNEMRAETDIQRPVQQPGVCESPEP